MTDNMRRSIRLVVSALVAGTITTVTSLLSTINASGTVQKGALGIAVLGGALVLLQNVQSSLSEPPKPTTPEVKP